MSGIGKRVLLVNLSKVRYHILVPWEPLRESPVRNLFLNNSMIDSKKRFPRTRHMDLLSDLSFMDLVSH